MNNEHVHPDDMRVAVGDAISALLGSRQNEMVTRWVVVVETIDRAGERAAWTLAPLDARTWDTLGLLAFGMQLEQAKAVTDALEDR